jgi:hypothetical protein
MTATASSSSAISIPPNVIKDHCNCHITYGMSRSVNRLGYDSRNFFSFPQRPNHFWGPFIILSNGHNRSPFTVGEEAGSWRYYRVLMMVYNTQRYWVFGLFPKRCVFSLLFRKNPDDGLSPKTQYLRVMKLTTHLHLVRRLRMRGTTSPYVSMACTRETLPLQFI